MIPEPTYSAEQLKNWRDGLIDLHGPKVYMWTDAEVAQKARAIEHAVVRGEQIRQERAKRKKR